MVEHCKAPVEVESQTSRAMGQACAMASAMFCCRATAIFVEPNDHDDKLEIVSLSLIGNKRNSTSRRIKGSRMQSF